MGPALGPVLRKLRMPREWLREVHMPREWLGLPIWLLLGIIGAWIATSKGRSGCFWFVLCAMLGPIGLVIAAVIPRSR